MTDSQCLLKGAKEAANALGLRPREIYHLLDHGLIPAKKIGGRWYFYRDDLIENFRVDAHRDDIRPNLKAEEADGGMEKRA